MQLLGPNFPPRFNTRLNQCSPPSLSLSLSSCCVALNRTTPRRLRPVKAGVAKLGPHATLAHRLLLFYPVLPLLQNASSEKTIGKKRKRWDWEQTAKTKIKPSANILFDDAWRRPDAHRRNKKGNKYFQTKPSLKEEKRIERIETQQKKNKGDKQGTWSRTRLNKSLDLRLNNSPIKTKQTVKKKGFCWSSTRLWEIRVSLSIVPQPSLSKKKMLRLCRHRLIFKHPTVVAHLLTLKLRNIHLKQFVIPLA